MGIELASAMVFAGTALTLLGVALFATWSILSSITAYFILLLHPTFRRGTFIRILDADNYVEGYYVEGYYVEGYIADIGLFNIKLIMENREAVVCPNNLVLGRPCLVKPRDRQSGVGNVSANPASAAAGTPLREPVENRGES